MILPYLNAFGVSGMVVGEDFRLGHGRVDGGVVLLQVVDRKLQQIRLLEFRIPGNEEIGRSNCVPRS